MLDQLKMKNCICERGKYSSKLLFSDSGYDLCYEITHAFSLHVDCC